MADEKRTDQPANIEKVDVNPDYLAQYIAEDKSLESLKKHRVVPRFKIVQPTTAAELQQKFGIGTAIVQPGEAMVVKFDAEPKYFDFVPLFFFKEWAKWRDLKGAGPMILDRSHDPVSELAKLSADKDARRELYPGHEAMPEADRMYNSYVEHIRFIGMIYGDHPLTGLPVTLSFERGEWGQGNNFLTAVSLRRQVVNGESIEVPLWAQVWRLNTVFHNPGQSKKWYGFDFEAAEQGIILPDEAPTMRAMHLDFADLFSKSRLMVDDAPETEKPEKADGSVKGHDEF